MRIIDRIRVGQIVGSQWRRKRQITIKINPATFWTWREPIRQVFQTPAATACPCNVKKKQRISYPASLTTVVALLRDLINSFQTTHHPQTLFSASLFAVHSNLSGCWQSGMNSKSATTSLWFWAWLADLFQWGCAQGETFHTFPMYHIPGFYVFSRLYL